MSCFLRKDKHGFYHLNIAGFRCDYCVCLRLYGEYALWGDQPKMGLPDCSMQVARFPICSIVVIRTPTVIDVTIDNVRPILSNEKVTIHPILFPVFFNPLRHSLGLAFLIYYTLYCTVEAQCGQLNESISLGIAQPKRFICAFFGIG